MLKSSSLWDVLKAAPPPGTLPHLSALGTRIVWFIAPEYEDETRYIVSQVWEDIVAIDGRKQLGHSVIVFCRPDNKEATGEVIHRSAMVFSFYDEPSYNVGVDHRSCTCLALHHTARTL
jgi:hypothetical protein